MITEKEQAGIDALVFGPTVEQVDAATLGEWLGLTPNRISALARDGVIPRTADKRFDLQVAIRAYCDHARAGSSGRRVDSELAAEKLRAAKATAEKLETANAKARGELAALSAFEREWAGILGDVRAALLALPSRAASRLGHLTPHDVKTLDREVRSILEELADD